jgi:ribonuclease P protein subunit POP4
MEEYLIAHELIGLECEVLESPNRYEEGIKGEIVDETMKTLLIKTQKGIRRVGKRERKFKIKFRGKNYIVSGDIIAFRPEERIKRGIILIKRFKGGKGKKLINRER